jgi:hypothetical protein
LLEAYPEAVTVKDKNGFTPAVLAEAEGANATALALVRVPR